MKAIIFILIINLFAISFCYSQHVDKSERKKIFNTALALFNEEQFEESLKMFLKLDSLQQDNFETKYYIGACYLNTKYAKTKGIPYLEYAIEKGEKLLPPDVFKDLGILYHLDYQFDKAVQSFDRYIDISFKDDENLNMVKRYNEIAENAKRILSDTLDVEIEKLAPLINSDQSELDPHVSADESVMYFTRESVNRNDFVVVDSISRVLYSEKKDGSWLTPVEITIDLENYSGDVSIAGISPDGNKMFVLLEESSGDKDLYTCSFSNNECLDLTRLNNKINSKYDEGKASITPDGWEFYFSSTRPGGYGGKDIYKITQDENGEWSAPINVGPVINTPYDEDAPFIHPDKKTLYFSSNGHNTIGGYDIFKSVYLFFENSWTEPMNLGYPINSTCNDLNFVLSADGNSGYFSSSQGNELGLHDIYKLRINKAIPLTLVKGIITAGTPPKPVPAKIRVYDNETGERVKYIYDPIPETGKYLMIFPPGKDYNMIIEAQGFLPRHINIYIPNQTYFYELFQEIHLSPVTMKSTGEVVGEEITIKNTFYDIYESSETDSIIGQTGSQKDYSKLLTLIEDLIESTDSIGLEKLDYYSRRVINTSSEQKDRYINKSYDDLLSIIERAIETNDSTSLDVLNQNTIYGEDVSDMHFYDLSDKKESLVDLIIGEDTVKVLPKLLTSEYNNASAEINGLLDNVSNNSEKDNVPDIRNSKPGQRRYILQTVVYYDVGDYVIKPGYEPDLYSIAEILIDQPMLGVEVNGYTDSQGTVYDNIQLSKGRARSVMEFFINQKVGSDKIIIQGYGEVNATNEKSTEEQRLNRKTEVKVFEISNEVEE